MFRSILFVLGNRENRAPAMAFMAIALGFGSWVTRLPEIKQSLALSEAQLGTALFFIPLGGVTLLPFYSKIIRAWGERLATTWSLTVFLLLIVWAGIPNSLTEWMVILYLLGLSMGLTDVAMNAAASEVESQKKRVIMSACHGFFSIGGMLGALLGSAFIATNQPIWIQLVSVSVVLMLLTWTHSAALINSVKTDPSTGFQWPKKEVVLLALVGLCIMMCEGGITDWSTIYLRETLTMPAAYSGLGFAGFSLFMALGRFSGDFWTVRYGRKRLMIIGALLGLVGLAITFLQLGFLAILGFSLAGLGYSVIVPTLFSSAARVEGVSAASGIASVASAGYIGLLVGPVVIGFIAEHYGLGNGFAFLLILTLTALLISFRKL
ncbi:MFS transporter [Roseivirga sp.]|uniref:MFS transporter n=1 Tax=Roseivirga sp. TaxID=1964215 RepID=UPI003B52F9E1